MTARKTILVLYYSRWRYPLRNTNFTHLYCWKNDSKHRVCYVNTAFGFPERIIRNMNIDAVIFHTSLLSSRWRAGKLEQLLERCRFLKKLECLKIALPQDEFFNTALLNDFINEFRVTHLLTCAYAVDWPIIYDKIDRDRVQIKTVLTGYLDQKTLLRINALKKQATPERELDLSYRAWRAEYWLGEHGMHKVWVGDIFQAAARRRGLKSDISLQAEDVLVGDDWFKFLVRSRATIGVEGGASVLDKDGAIKTQVDAYLQAHPNAAFDEVRAHCFPQEDHRLSLACISPRHLECCATETGQILIEGTFNGILLPGKHYFPIKKDYSNIEEALDFLQDDKQVRAMVKRAYDDVVLSGRWTYEAFVQEQEKTILDLAPSVKQKAPAWVSNVMCAFLNGRDTIFWRFIRIEVESKPKEGQKSPLIQKWKYKISRQLLKFLGKLD